MSKSDRTSERRPAVSPVRLAVAGVLLAVAGVFAWLQRPSAVRVEPAETIEEAALAVDEGFSLVFQWGACTADAARDIVAVDGPDRLTVSRLNADQLTGRESTRTFTESERQALARVLNENEVFALPSVITAPEDIVHLEPGCSRLEIDAGGRRHIIDEADGIDPHYYRIKTHLQTLGAEAV
jgi:hypothetical protein